MWAKLIEILFAVWYVPFLLLLTVFWGFIGFVASFFSLNVGRLTLRYWSYCCFAPALMKVKINGLENLSNLDLKKGLVIYSNHQAYTDIPALAIGLPKIVAFVAKKDLLKIPILGSQIKRMHYSIDRGDLRAAQRLIEQGVKDLNNGVTIVVFPEGTRNKTENTLLPFKKGAFILAKESQCPLIPAAILGTEKIWPEKRWLPRCGTIVINLGNALYPEKDESLAVLTRRARLTLMEMLGGLKKTD